MPDKTDSRIDVIAPFLKQNLVAGYGPFALARMILSDLDRAQPPALVFKIDAGPALDLLNEVSPMLESLVEERSELRKAIDALSSQNATLVSHVEQADASAAAVEAELTEVEEELELVSNKLEIANTVGELVASSLNELVKENRALREDNRSLAAVLEDTQADLRAAYDVIASLSPIEATSAPEQASAFPWARVA